jgi:hypothetical protein
VPARTCVGCGAVSPQAELLRFVRLPDGRLALDAARRAPGRGGYLHRAPACWQRFRQRGGPVRSLRATVDRADRAAFIEHLQHRDGE